MQEIKVEEIELVELNKPYITVANDSEHCEAVVDRFKTKVIAELEVGVVYYKRNFVISSKQKLSKDKIKEILDAFIKLQVATVEHVNVNGGDLSKLKDPFVFYYFG